MLDNHKMLDNHRKKKIKSVKNLVDIDDSQSDPM